MAEVITQPHQSSAHQLQTGCEGVPACSFATALQTDYFSGANEQVHAAGTMHVEVQSRCCAGVLVEASMT